MQLCGAYITIYSSNLNYTVNIRLYSKILWRYSNLLKLKFKKIYKTNNYICFY